MSTREDVKTFFGLPLDFSMLELEPETDADPVRYFCTPENAEIIGWGSCGTHFVLLPGDEAVYCVEPELAEEGTFVLPVGADFREFLSHLFYCKCTSPLAQIFMLDATRFRKLLEDNDANTWPSRSMGQGPSPSAPYSAASSSSRVVFKTVILTFFMDRPPGKDQM